MQINKVRKWVGDLLTPKPTYITGNRKLREKCKSTIASHGKYYIDRILFYFSKKQLN